MTTQTGAEQAQEQWACPSGWGKPTRPQSLQRGLQATAQCWEQESPSGMSTPTRQPKPNGPALETHTQET